MMNYLVYGYTVTQYVNKVGEWGLGVVMLLVGFGLIIAAVRDLYAGLAPANKDMKKAGIGVAIGILGALIMYWGATNIMGFFKGLSTEVPHN